MVDGSSFFSGSDEGYFGMKISRVAPDPRPANDYICSAYTLSNSFLYRCSCWYEQEILISVQELRVQQLTQLLKTTLSGFDLDHTVWYKFTAPPAAIAATGALCS
jgi:hypothetical protein